MIVLHISPVDMKTSNGLRFSVPGLVAAQNKLEGVEAGIMNIGNREQLNLDEVEKFEFEFMEYVPDISKLKAPYSKPDIVVFHGVYREKYIRTYKNLLRTKIPYVIVPRVSMTNGAQKQKHLKKKLGNFLFFNRFINNAAKIHYLTENEMNLSRIFEKDYFIVGNGINPPLKYEKKVDKDRVNITYMGRYDINHKGLDVLVESINIIKDKLKNKNVVINFYGSDYDEGRKFLNRKICNYELGDVFKINNPIFGAEKKKVLQETDVFIATSRFEGHPMAVIEAMSYSVPCILSEGTNMLDVLNLHNAGWSTTLEPDTISKTIIDAISTRETIDEKGKNARILVEENYTWEKVAKDTIKAYEEVIYSKFF